MVINFTSLGAEGKAPQEVVSAVPGSSLVLKKNALLDLGKTVSGLTKIDFCMGWDISTIGTNIDLDISVLACHEGGKILSSNDVIFYNHKEVPGVSLNGDNRTGAGDGDDEIISIILSEVDPSVSKLVCCVTIDQATARHQTFGMVSNSYVRLVNKETGAEIAKFVLKDDYATSTAIVFAELVRDNENWVFHTIGEGLVGDLNQVAARFQ